MKKKKICLIASSGGHFEQILSLKELEKNYDVFFVTEKADTIKKNNFTYFLPQVNRREFKTIFIFWIIFFKSLYIFFKEKPDVVISTGALCVIPMFFICKVFKKKLVFIESFAKIKTPTLTGKLLYKITDLFIIQWKDLYKFYPNATYLGGIY